MSKKGHCGVLKMAGGKNYFIAFFNARVENVVYDKEVLKMPFLYFINLFLN